MPHDKLRGLLSYWFGPNGERTPRDYTVIDIETTGFSPKSDLILELGWAIVRDGRLVDCNSSVLNWYAHPGIDRAWLTRRLEETGRNIREKGDVYHFTPERLLAEGGQPQPILEVFADILRGAMSRPELLVGHNAWAFDRRMIDAMAGRYLGHDIDWVPGGIWDTGLLEKAALQERAPWPGETVDAWFKRAASPPHNVKWRLVQNVVPKYNLQQRFNLDLSQNHRAAFDCLCAYHFFEVCREIAQGMHG